MSPRSSHERTNTPTTASPYSSRAHAWWFSFRGIPHRRRRGSLPTPRTTRLLLECFAGVSKRPGRQDPFPISPKTNPKLRPNPTKALTCCDTRDLGVYLWYGAPLASTPRDERRSPWPASRPVSRGNRGDVGRRSWEDRGEESETHRIPSAK